LKRKPIKTEPHIKEIDTEEIQPPDLNPKVRQLGIKRDGCVSGGGSGKGKGKKGGKGWTVDWGKNNKWSVHTPNTGGGSIRGAVKRKNSNSGA